MAALDTVLAKIDANLDLALARRRASHALRVVKQGYKGMMRPRSIAIWGMPN